MLTDFFKKKDHWPADFFKKSSNSKATNHGGWAVW